MEDIYDIEPVLVGANPSKPTATKVKLENFQSVSSSEVMFTWSLLDDSENVLYGPKTNVTFPGFNDQSTINNMGENIGITIVQ